MILGGLSKEDLAKTSVIFAFVTDSRGKPMEQALGRYAFGLALTSKNDFHLRTETEAFIAFYLSLKDAMKINGDWDDTSDFIEAVKKVFSQFGDFKDIENLFMLGSNLVNAKKDENTQPVTLTEVFGMKIYVDVYFDLLASKMPKPSSKK